ncbi:hypothetical protein GH714_017220 [Hevea brasiliensis]|uniref:Uncharacterized protein n=1 Tax=Hevea brasiliensis TaxID=3981 RepID=A0A6A6L6Q3_HEVBR|nr:hypothetical protein GH714_017220 [Hevea brasiliensis]
MIMVTARISVAILVVAMVGIIGRERIVEQLIHSLVAVRMLYFQEERFCQCSFINRHVEEAWSKTEGQMCCDEENMGATLIGLKFRVSKLGYVDIDTSCFDVIGRKELDLLTSEIILNLSQGQQDLNKNC